MNMSDLPDNSISGLSGLLEKLLEHPQALPIIIVLAATVVLWKYINNRWQ